MRKKHEVPGKDVQLSPPLGSRKHEGPREDSHWSPHL